MEETLLHSLAEIGTVNTLFVILVIGLFYAMFKYLPMAWKAHIELLRDMHSQFSKDLEQIATEHTKMNEAFYRQIDRLTCDHDRQNQILDKLDRTQDKIYNRIKGQQQ